MRVALIANRASGSGLDPEPLARAMREHGADALIVRPFSVYGPGQRPEMAFARWIVCLGAGPGAEHDYGAWIAREAAESS